MSWPYHYTPYIWPMLATAAFISVLAIYAWRRRSVPGALYLAIAFLFGALWAVSAALVLAAVDVSTKIFWTKFIAAVCLMPIAIARFCFVLGYAGLGRWLTRWTLTLLAIPVLLQFILALTNDIHHLVWLGFDFDRTVRPQLGVASWALTGFGYLLLLVNVIILARLFFHSPQHRWPVALLISAMLITHTFYMLDVFNLDLFAPLDATVLSMNISFVLYALALFHFHMFDPIQAARKMVIEQMREGMIVLDTGQKIVDLNPGAERILSLPAEHVRGRNVADVLPASAGMATRLDGNDTAQSEFSLERGSEARFYALHLSSLKDRSGQTLGSLVLLQDITEQKRARAQQLEQQRAQAALSERDRLARELHDELSQELTFINLQAQACQAMLASGQVSQAEAAIARLAEIARQSQIDVRELIGFLINPLAEDGDFLGALRRTVEGFGQKSGVQAELEVGAGLPIASLEPAIGVQLLRVTQEALTNVRKHACAQHVWVRLAPAPGGVLLLIEDDGVGFDQQALSGEVEGFGMRIMHERVAEIGGVLNFSSLPGRGTRVSVQVPAGNPQVN